MYFPSRRCASPSLQSDRTSACTSETATPAPTLGSAVRGIRSSFSRTWRSISCRFAFAARERSSRGSLSESSSRCARSYIAAAWPSSPFRSYTAAMLL